jgi:hypothetical protein
MATYTKIKLSESNSSNSPISDESYNTGGYTVLHTASSTSGVMDEVWLWISNIDSSTAYDVKIGLSTYSGPTGPVGNIDYFMLSSVGPQTTILALAGFPIMAGAQLYFENIDGSSSIAGFGYVNRITP